MASPVELFDAVPGNRGLRGPAKLLFHFEEPTGVLPSDAEGNLADLATDGVATTMPTVVSTWTGRGRSFNGTTSGLIASDLAGRNTLMQRDVTVQAILSFGATNENYRTLIARGINDGTASERRSYEIVLVKDPDEEGVSTIWQWHDSAGVVRAVQVGGYERLSIGALFLLTTTRRWEAANRVVLRTYIDDRLLGEAVSTFGDIAGGTTGRTTVGAQKNAGVWSQHYQGTIDELAVYDYEKSPEEVRADWKRLYEHQPGGVETLRGLIPPGAPWMRDPGNKIGRRMKVVGQGLGGAAAVADELREMFLPDRASKEQLARWESIYRISARPRDSLDQRRERLLGVAGREEGFSHPAVKAALEGLLKTADPSELTIIEGTNIISDPFTTTFHDYRWLRGDLGTWAIVAGTVRVTVPAASDVRWETSMWGAHMRTSLDTGGTGPSFVSAKIVTWSLPANSGAGIMLAERRSNTGIWYGIYNDAGTTRLMYRFVTRGVASPPVDTGAVGAAPIWLRLYRPTSGPNTDPGFFRLAWSTTGPDTGFSEIEIETDLPDAEWGGFGVFGTSASLAAQLTMDLDDWNSWCPNGTRPHHWYVLREEVSDPGDLVGANALLQRLKPAHTVAAVIINKSLLANNTRDGLVGRNPMGLVHTLAS